MNFGVSLLVQQLGDQQNQFAMGSSVPEIGFIYF